MPIGIGSGLWGVVLPAEKTNFIQNPSGEYGTIGAAGLDGGAVGTSSQYQVFGAWAFQITPAAGGTSGGLMGTWAVSTGSAYSVSAYVRGPLLGTVMIAAADTAGANIVGSVVGLTLTDRWQQFSFKYTANANTTHRMVIRKTGNDTIGATPIYADGLQVEMGSATTYIDGDQPGGTWLGAPHNSQSYRSGQYRSGGSIVALADLGLSVDQMLGVGMPPIEDSSQSYAITDGAQFQRQRAASRHFTLTAKPIVGTSLVDFHTQRRTLIDVFKPDAVTPQQPITFVYYGGPGTVMAQAYYEKGLELGNMDGPIAENAAISFVSYDPYWYLPQQQGTTLAPRVSLGSVNYIAKRSPLGAWGTLGQKSGTTIQVNVSPNLTSVDDILINPGGTVILGGYFGSVSGTVSGPLAQYYPLTNLFGTFTGGTVGVPGAEVTTLAQTPSGTLFFAGNFALFAGTAFPRIGQNVNGAWGTLPNGTIDNVISKILFNPFGTLFVGGAFSLAAGSTARRLAQHANGSWGTVNQQAGTLDNNVTALAWGLDNTSLYVGGNFGSAGGTAAVRVAKITSNAWGTLGSGANGGGTQLFDLATKLDGRIAIAGNFITMGGGTVNGLAEWNGVQSQPDGLGLNGIVRSLFVRNDNSMIVAGSFQSAGSINVPDNIAIWNGAAYLPLDLDLPPGAEVYTATQAPDNTLYIGGAFSGTGYAASVGTIQNSGRAIVYPNLRLRNLSTGTARAFQMLNTTTGVGIWLNYTMLPGEQADLTLQPGDRAFQSSMRGNIISAILPGSNLATFNLLPGQNYISFFADNDSLEASLYWTPRSWSVDGGTIL